MTIENKMEIPKKELAKEFSKITIGRTLKVSSYAIRCSTFNSFTATSCRTLPDDPENAGYVIIGSMMLSGVEASIGGMFGLINEKNYPYYLGAFIATNAMSGAYEFLRKNYLDAQMNLSDKYQKNEKKLEVKINEDTNYTR